MYDVEQDKSARRFYAISFADEEPVVANGSLIPPARLSFTPRQLALPARTPRLLIATRVFVALATLVLVVAGAIGSFPYLHEQGTNLLASLQQPVMTTPVVVEHPYTRELTPLSYGIQVAFSEPNFFLATRDAFIEGSKTFIEADLATMKLRYFEAGILHKEYPILKKGEEGSFFETPAGLYEVEHKKVKHYTSFSQMYLPHSISFQGNFYIHGTPFYETGEKATSTQRSGIELSDEDADDLYTLVALGTPVLVYDRVAEPDEFLYEPKVPELATPHYLLADIKSNTVLASSDLDAAVPIASLTKLMTAVVAAEYINLDSRIAISAPTFVQSLIPRLEERSSVSMYSLLELLLLESSNEAAEVIASEVGRATFIEYMNERAKALGMDSTVFTDPAGLESTNVSSVGDLLRLIQYIYEKRRFIIDISAGKKLPDMYVSREFSGLANFNDVSGLDNFIGGKIGETTAAGQTSVTLHTLKVKDTERIVAIIILGSEGRTADVQALMKYAEERFGN
jgi:serine-type D-Ala-D-Ala endopeptidase (penicillin-binding protein 7)